MLTVKTGENRGAGTDAKVYVIMFGGEDGEVTTGKVWLKNKKKDNFESGQEDRFTITCSSEMDLVQKLIIGHDNSRLGAGWFLENVSVF